MWVHAFPDIMTVIRDINWYQSILASKHQKHEGNLYSFIHGLCLDNIASLELLHSVLPA